MISLDNGRRERLTTPPPGAFGDTQCAFSPDGHRLAVSRYMSRNESDLYVAGADSGGNAALERLTYSQDGIGGIDWAPDGRTIVFGSESGLWKISASPAAGEEPVSLIGAGVRAMSPSVPVNGGEDVRHS
jgi:Tol biopolymer transport system component